MSIVTSYHIDQATRFLVKEVREVTDEVRYPTDSIWTETTVYEDLGGSHDLTKIYIDLALRLWKPEEIGFSDLIEKERNKGFTSWEGILKLAIKEVA